MVVDHPTGPVALTLPVRSSSYCLWVLTGNNSPKLGELFSNLPPALNFGAGDVELPFEKQFFQSSLRRVDQAPPS